MKYYFHFLSCMFSMAELKNKVLLRWGHLLKCPRVCELKGLNVPLEISQVTPKLYIYIYISQFLPFFRQILQNPQKSY